MEIVGYIIGGLHLIVGIIITVGRSLDDLLSTAKEKIQLELVSAYKEFSNVSSSEIIVGGGGDVLGILESVSNRLMRIHYASNFDVVKIQRIEWFGNKLLPIIIISMALVVCSILAGMLLIDKNDTYYKIILIIYFPISLFLIELLILYILLKSEKFLKKLSTRYVSRQY